MHELSVTNGILSVVLKHAEKNGVQKVVGVGLRIGELSDLQDEWIQSFFDHLSKNTIAAGAKLHIERVPVVFGCQACGRQFSVPIKEIDKACCPDCQGKKLDLVSGREYIIQNIEVM